MKITVKTPEEIEVIRTGGKLLAKILTQVRDSAISGVSTKALDEFAERLIREAGGAPSFLGYRVSGITVPYPASICTSINDEIVHAIPRKDRVLRDGDIVGLDIGMWYPVDTATSYQLPATNRKKGLPEAGSWKLEAALATDMAITIGVGNISREAERLIHATREALDAGIQAVRPGRHIGDIGAAVERRLRQDTLGIIRDLAGHGVGYQVHEGPCIPNFGKPGTGTEIKEGMVLAIEPMATLGRGKIVLAPDQWTYKTADGSLGAHFEHTIAVTKNGAEVLTQ